MKIAFQNFMTTLKRYKTASVLNIAGLTIAFIAFYILMAQVHHGLSYNSSIPDYESKRVFAHALRDIEVSTIERKMSHTESECRIKLDGEIA